MTLLRSPLRSVLRSPLYGPLDGPFGLPAVAYTFNVGTEFQVIDGAISAELQSDSIEGDGTGIQESNTKGLPFGLTAPEQTRFADEVLSYEGHPLTYVRLALGLYYRGVSADGKSFTRERISGQNASIKAALDRNGVKLAVGHWSPAPFWKNNGAFVGTTEPIPDRDTQPTQWNTYMRAGLQGGTLTCPDKVGDPTGYAAWQTAFAASVLATLEYIHQNVGCVGIYFYQNEPSISTSYPSCVWLGVQAYDHLVKMRALIDASVILATYGGQPNTIYWQGDEQNGQTGLGMGTARTDAALMASCYGWSWHRIDQMANDRNWAHNNLGALTGNLSGFASRAFCSEYEFFDQYVTVGDVDYMSEGQRFSNIISNAFRFFSEAASRIHYWIHVGKNSDGPVAERNGRALMTWRPTGASAPSDYPSLAQGEFTPIKVNYNANMAMVRHILAGSTRVGVTVPAYDNNIATLGLRRSDQRHVFGIVNSGSATRRVQLDTGGLTFTGKSYNATTFGSARGQQVGIIDTTIPGYTAEFWVQDQTIPFVMSAPTLAPGNALITVTHAAAPNNGGAAITGYDLRHSTDQSNWTTVSMSTNPQDITSLINATPYFVQTRAINAIGNGPWSASATATPTAVAADFTTSFPGTSGADITTITGFTRIDGTASSLTISSGNACNSNSTDANGTLYQMPTTGQAAQRVLFTVGSGSSAAGAAVCVRAQNRDNYVGVRWSTTSFTIAQRVAGGTTTVIGTSAGVTPTAGQVCQIEVDASGNVRLLVSGTQRIAPVAVDVSLTDQHTGLLSRSIVKQTFVDDVTSGPN